MAPSASPTRPAGSHTVITHPSNQKRTSTPKVRTGCITCKNRHVKCDERKPTCSRCEKARMECHGYLAKTDQKTTRKSNRSVTVRRGPRPLQVIRPALTPLSCAKKDIIFFDFYRYSLVKELARYLHANFWSGILLCESIRDDCVRHAILALGALSQALFIDSTCLQTSPGHQSTDSSPSPVHPELRAHHVLNPHYQAAIHHQNQAISLYLQRTRDERDKMPAGTLLVMTLLLVTYELLQGDLDVADGLMSSGIRVFRDSITMLRETVDRHHAISSSGKTEEEIMEDMECILPFLSAISENFSISPQQLPQCPMFGAGSACGDSDLPISGQTSAVRCAYLWSKVHVRCLLFAAKAMHHTFGGQSLSAGGGHPFLQEQTNLAILLRQWQQVLSDFRAAVHPEDLRTRRMMQLLSLQCCTNIISLAWCLDPTDTALDSCESDFSQLLATAQDSLENPDLMFKVGYTFSGGDIAGPLILVAAKCRASRGLRLKALGLFRKMSWREGSWDAKAFVSVLGLVTLEEAMRDEKGWIDPTNRWLWTGIRPGTDMTNVVAEYTRLIPDKKGETIKRCLDLDLDRWELGQGEEIELNFANEDIDMGNNGSRHVRSTTMSQGLGSDPGGNCVSGGASPASATTGTSDFGSPSPGLREGISNWDGFSTYVDDAIFNLDSMDLGDGYTCSTGTIS
ncbi:hypothetical protein QBC40DRAFT_275678 [Triangularia verruculosa]|uniref:Zn(2)-C6 fungal-type domain-containing protein n=1 Tax=Triangularia verruculosa TaxID=2587418 RepID=A0AAN6XL30_9PEZI|nr:hypothetical protein QBC40DRAFT_275678 [Triangularia verruculosa]